MFVGIDHSTTGVKSCILRQDGSRETFVIERSPDEDSDWSYTDRLRDYVDLDRLKMIALGYSYGDGFSSIKRIGDTENRGIVDKLGLGHDFGTGTLVFDELAESSLPCVVYPGVHSGIDTLHPYFAYHSPMAGADKVAMTRYAQSVTDEGSDFVAACVSSSEIATLVTDGELTGAFTFMGLIHGWPSPEELRGLAADKQELHDLIMRSGFLCRSGEPFESVKGVPDPEFLEMACCATLHNVYSLLPFAKHELGRDVDEIVLSGRLSRLSDTVDVQGRLEDSLSAVAPVRFCESYSTALGAAYIARDVAAGASEILGLPVEATASVGAEPSAGS